MLQLLFRYLPLRNILPQSANVAVKAKCAVLQVTYEKRVRMESSKSFPGVSPSREPVANTPFITNKFLPPLAGGSDGDVQPWTWVAVKSFFPVPCMTRNYMKAFARSSSADTLDRRVSVYARCEPDQQHLHKKKKKHLWIHVVFTSIFVDIREECFRNWYLSFHYLLRCFRPYR